MMSHMSYKSYTTYKTYTVDYFFFFPFACDALVVILGVGSLAPVKALLHF